MGDLPNIDRDFEVQRRQVGLEAERQRQRIATEAQEAEERLRRQQSDIEREAEAAIGQARKAEALEQRKRDLPYTRPRELGTKQRIAEVERVRTEAFGEVEKGKEAIRKAKETALSDVSQWEAESQAAVQKAEKEYGTAVAELRRAEESQAQWEAENVKLDYIDPTANTNQYISKSEWDTMTPQAQNYIKKNGVDAYNAWALTHYWECTTQTPQETFVQAQKEGKIPKVAKLKNWKDDGTLVWDMPPVTITTEGIVYSISPGSGATKPTLITELAPQSSESVWNKIKSYLKKQFVTGWDVPDQETLKEKYEKQSEAPLWSRLLFGPTVIYDKKSDQYYPLVLNIADIPVTGVGGGMNVATRVTELPITRAAWEAILASMNKAEAAQLSRVNWSAITQAIKAGKIRDAEEAVKWAAAQARWFKPITAPVLTEEQQAIQAARTAQGMADAAEAAARVRAAEGVVSLTRAGTTFVMPSLTAAPMPSKQEGEIELEPIIGTSITIGGVTRTIKEWESMTPKKAVISITASGLVTIAIATDPVAMSRIITKMTPAQRANVLTAVSPAIANALKVNALAKAQVLAIEQIQVQAQLRTLTQQAAKLVNQLQTQGKTQVQIRTALQNLIQSQIQEMVKTQTMTKTQAQTATQILTRTAIQIATRTPTLTRTQTATRIRETTKPREPILPRTPPIKFKLPDGSKHTLTEKELAGAVGWRQGMLRRKADPEDYRGAIAWKQGMGWYAIDNAGNIDFLRTPPPKAVFTTRKAAYDTIQSLYGVSPKKLVYKMGIMRVEISKPTKEGELAIKFTKNGESLTDKEVQAIWERTGNLKDFYKIIYPPYGEKNIVNTTKLIPGIKYFKGAKSAYRSIAKLGGKLPPTIKRTMGIVGITITTLRSGEPQIAFERRLTPEQRKGAVGWRQGFIYKLVYPPFGERDIINTREPIKGIPYHAGVKSAYQSIVRLGGKVPAEIRRDMGIQDVIITTPRDGKPKLMFRPDIQQRTHLTKGRRPKRARRRPHAASQTSVSLSRGRV